MMQAPPSPVAARAPPSTPRNSHVSTASSSSASSRPEKSQFIAAGGLTALRAAAERIHISDLKYDPATADCHVDIYFTLKPGVQHPNFGEEDLIFHPPNRTLAHANARALPRAPPRTQVRSPTAPPPSPAPPLATVRRTTPADAKDAASLQPDNVWLARRKSEAPGSPGTSSTSIASPRAGIPGSPPDRKVVGVEAGSSPTTPESTAVQTPGSASEQAVTPRPAAAAGKSLPASPITPFKTVTVDAPAAPTPAPRSPGSGLSALRKKASLFGRDRKGKQHRQAAERGEQPGVERAQSARIAQKKESREARKKMASAWATVGGESTASETMGDASASAAAAAAASLKNEESGAAGAEDGAKATGESEYPGALFDERRQAMASPKRTNSTKVVERLNDLTRRASRKMSMRTREES